MFRDEDFRLHFGVATSVSLSAVMLLLMKGTDARVKGRGANVLTRPNSSPPQSAIIKIQLNWRSSGADGSHEHLQLCQKIFCPFIRNDSLAPSVAVYWIPSESFRLVLLCTICSKCIKRRWGDRIWPYTKLLDRYRWNLVLIHTLNFVTRICFEAYWLNC